jgi:hypothetical protein
MRPEHCPASTDLAAHQRGVDDAAIRAAWIEQMELEILEDLRSSGRWYSHTRRLTFYPRDAMDCVQELDPELIFRHDTAVATFWQAAQLGPEFDRGQMRLDAAAVLENVVGLAVEKMVKQLAEREWEILQENKREH